MYVKRAAVTGVDQVAPISVDLATAIRAGVVTALKESDVASTNASSNDPSGSTRSCWNWVSLAAP